MPPKRAVPQKGIPPPADANAFTPENFEKELKDLAAKARQQTPLKEFQEQALVLSKAALLLSLAAVYANVSQLVLSPVYGGIPSAIWHPQLTMAACFAGWSSNLWLRRNLSVKPITLLGPIAIYIPTVHYFLLQLSGILGPVAGPVVTEALTLVPLLLLSVSCTATILDGVDMPILHMPKPVGDAAPGIISWAFFRIMVYQSGRFINSTIGSAVVITRLGLQILLGVLYSLAAPSKLLRWTIPALLHTSVLNTHLQTPYMTQTLDDSLMKSGWTILDRQDSLTGYISVIESKKDGFRVMRCDHSLLGGQWEKVNGKFVVNTIVKEPIYAIFAMLEAVRLVQVRIKISDKDAHALVIGAGIGTTPAAFMAHGINTTIVEIDPVVHKYAMKHFSLSPKHTAVIDDAVSYTEYLAKNTSQRYDYVVHDVFTGGAEPVELFTLEFIQNLYDVLKPEGVIAINYAGDLLMPSSRIVVRTIKSVFPTCRVFRELEAPTSETVQEQGQDFTNMVIFCTKTTTTGLGSHKTPATIQFRKPVEGDYLRSGARKQYLLPKYEIEQEVFAEVEGDGGVLRKNDTGRLSAWQQKSAVGHWHVMRTVLPDAIWQAW